MQVNANSVSRPLFTALSLIAVLCSVGGCWAGTTPAAGTSVSQSLVVAPAASDILTVGVLPFEARDKELARDVTEIVTAGLSMNPRLRLTERSRMDEVLRELGLSKAGVADPQTAQKVGYLAGAEVLVWGRLFLIDSQVMVTARAVGVETGRVFVEQVRGAQSDDLVPLIDLVARKVQERIITERRALLAPEVRDDLQANLNQLAEKLKGKRPPKVVIVVNEEHLGGVDFDPAAETELMYWFAHCNVPVVDVSSLRVRMRQWAKDYYPETSRDLPHLIPEDVGVLVVGEAFSEPAGTYGPLNAARYRVEVRAMDRSTRDLIVVARRTGTYADSAMVSAGKNGLQRAAASIAYEIIPKIADYVPRGASAGSAATGPAVGGE